MAYARLVWRNPGWAPASVVTEGRLYPVIEDSDDGVTFEIACDDDMVRLYRWEGSVAGKWVRVSFAERLREFNEKVQMHKSEEVCDGTHDKG